MTQKDLIRTIKQNMPQDLNELEIARYIYIELGKQRNFDTRYFYGNRRTRKKIYKLAEEAEDNPERFHNKKTLICVSLSYLYQNLLREFGIESNVILDEIFDDGHLMPVIKLKDGRRIRADLQVDLERIQAGMKTKEFGTQVQYDRNYDVIGEDELKEIDKKIGYIKEDYKDRDIEELKEAIQGMSAADSLRTIMSDERTYRNINLQGHVERRKYFGYLINRLVRRYKNNKIYLFTCYREKDNDSDSMKRDYSLCAYSYEKEEIEPYLYSTKEERFVPVTIEKLAELQESGLIFGTREHTNGVKLLKKIIKNHEKNEQENKEESVQTRINDIER